MSKEGEGSDGLVMEIEDLAETDVSSQWCLVGRFLTNRSIHFQSMQNTLAALWKPVKGVWIKDLGSSCFSFQFYHENDILYVERVGPCTFGRAVLITKRLEANE